MGKKTDAASDNKTELQMTPMIDVVFLLLIFFMCATKFKIPEASLDAFLPRDRGDSTKTPEISRGCRVWLRLEDMRPEEAVEPSPETAKHLIHVYGADKKGIVHRITKHLADQSVNITNLHTQAIHHEQPLYVMLIEVEIPPYVDVGALQEELGKIGGELNVHISFKPKDDARF